MKTKDLKDILNRYKIGEVTPDERNLVESWMLFGKMPYRNLSEAELSADLRMIEKTLPIVKSENKSKIWWSSAAAIFLCILGFYLYKSSFNSTQLTLKYANDIRPGRNGAMLILANGRKINLNEVRHSELASEAGVGIKITSNGELIYTVRSNKKIGSLNSTSEVFNTVVVPAGGQYQIRLPDGSKVWLNSNSSLRFPVEFNNKERNVDIVGEGYFEVAHLKSKPFKVKSAGQTIEVLGTHFNITAYANEKISKVTLLEGSVKVENGKDTKVLVPGQQAKSVSGGIDVVTVDVADAVAWKNGYFRFNENLKSIMTKISRWYDVDIVYEEEPDEALIFEGEISRSKNISAVLTLMESTGNAHFKIEGRRVIVRR
ncbi:hypothetical protein DBR11_05600 [Pedobacter sp. HMWF019]|uniref:FecR family protein n=1 Tax=Pedobacter sp. HMWF019 TaxID=2056856 RepID=UPI000D33FE5B|nr:FecR family protein [Pedobacter sp. HMWF019]PTT02177.1 hypothetical protein DBR11_05600 [Pedobacter sp. HMWF019]